MTEHFNVHVRTKKGLHLDRETYAVINPKSSFPCALSGMKAHGFYADSEGKYYKDEWCQQHRLDCLENFDTNMKFFSSLDHDKLNEELDALIKKRPEFKEVQNLNDYDNVTGCYIMVLDGYSQIYVGVAQNIKKRIQSHWSKTVPFDRLLFPIGAVKESVMSIDCFCALDTTRIFASAMDFLHSEPNVEDNILAEFSKDFACNRIGGGTAITSLEALATRKSREL